MSAAQHLPSLPLAVEHRDTSDEIVDAAGAVVAVECYPFIVRACNSHDALLAALEDAERRMIDNEERIEGEWGNCRSREQMEADHAWSDTIYAARAAIKLAKGEA